MSAPPLTWPPIVALALLTLVGGGAIGYAVGNSDSGGDTTTVVSDGGAGTETGTTAATTAATTETTTAEAQADAAALEGKLASCDNGSPTTELIGSVRVTNSGTEPATAAVDFSYVLSDGSTIPAEQQTVEVAPGAREFALFSTSVSRRESDQFMDHPGWLNSKNCEFNVEAAP